MFSWNKEEEPTNGPVHSERPSWLQDDAETGAADGKDWDTSDKAATSSGVTLDPHYASNNKNKNKKNRASKNPGAEEKGPWCKRLSIFGFSLFLLAGFLWLAVDNKQEGGKVKWYVFYALSAVAPALFLCHYMLCFPFKAIYFYCFGMMCWSVVEIILLSLDVKATPKSDNNGNENGRGRTVRQQMIWELVWISVACFSALYHGAASKCFVASRAAAEDDK